MDGNVEYLHVINWVIVVLYIAFMLFVGFYFSKKQKGFDIFLRNI